MLNNKSCSKCNVSFQCGAEGEKGGCWCNDYPPLFAPDPLINCMCQPCLHNAVKEKIDAYVLEMTPGKAIADNKAARLPESTRMQEGIDYYIENSLYVFTAWHHLKRGYCCNNSCRHCPYGFKKDML
jgi:hypothetical protein